MKARVPLPDLAQMTEAQRRIHDSIMASRGSLNGPFLAWLHSPGLASPAEQLGAFCRFGTGFSRRESEMIILCVAGHYQCAGEQAIHEPIALEAGLSSDDLAQLRNRQTPSFTEPRLRLLHRLSSVLITEKSWPDELYQAGEAEFGTVGMVEIVGIVGYYALTAYTLNAFKMQV